MLSKNIKAILTIKQIKTKNYKKTVIIQMKLRLSKLSQAISFGF